MLDLFVSCGQVEGLEKVTYIWWAGSKINDFGTYALTASISRMAWQA